MWETLEETGALTGFLPEWERIRLLPHASVIHRFTVDRHVVETCIEASTLIRAVARPDVLMVAALLHDIGKGSLTEHSVAGEPVARAIATRMGFEPESVDLIALLVRWHLLLAETATTRDPDDPATIDVVTSKLGTGEALSLLAALTEADAKATSPKAWSSWRSGLIRDLGRRAHAALDSGVSLPPIVTDDIPIPADLRSDSVSISVEPVRDGSRVTTIALDRVGLLADFAAMFALHRIPVRAARVWSQGEHGISVWEVADEHLDAAILRTKYEAVAGGSDRPRRAAQPGARGRAGADRGLPPGGQRPGDRARGARRRPPGGASTWSAAPSPTSTWPCARPTSTRSARRRSTSSTCWRPRPAPSRRPGRPRRRTPYARCCRDCRRDRLGWRPSGHDHRGLLLFATLSDRLADTFKNLRGKGRLSEADIDATAREIRIALLEADVALPVVKEFVAAVKERSRGEEVSGALNPAQQIIKIVNDELVEILGGETRRLRYAKSGPTVIMLAGLQGAGKTTLAAKLALWLKEQGKQPVLVAADLQRPNAVNQLQVNGERAGVPVFAPEPGNGVGDPVAVARASIEEAKRKLYDVVIVDTAGRLGVDAELMQQAADIRDAVQPDEVLFVVDAMIGQDAVHHGPGLPRGRRVRRCRAHQARRRRPRWCRAVDPLGHRQAGDVRERGGEGHRLRRLPPRPDGRPDPRHGRHDDAHRAG